MHERAGPMHLWILTRIHRQPAYDVFNGHVIRAESEERARQMANQAAVDEGRIWLDPEKSLCSELTAYGPEGIMLSDFNAG